MSKTIQLSNGMLFEPVSRGGKTGYVDSQGRPQGAGILYGAGAEGFERIEIISATFKDGKVQGKARITYKNDGAMYGSGKDSGYYEGEVDQNFVPCGQGIRMPPTETGLGRIYEGTFKGVDPDINRRRKDFDRYLTGRGVVRTLSGQYEMKGDFVYGLPHGEVEIREEEGLTFVGRIKNKYVLNRLKTGADIEKQSPEVQGVMTFPNGMKFQGSFEMGSSPMWPAEPKGIGTVTYPGGRQEQACIRGDGTVYHPRPRAIHYGLRPFVGASFGSFLTTKFEVSNGSGETLVSKKVFPFGAARQSMRLSGATISSRGWLVGDVNITETGTQEKLTLNNVWRPRAVENRINLLKTEGSANTEGVSANKVALYGIGAGITALFLAVSGAFAQEVEPQQGFSEMPENHLQMQLPENI